MRIMRTTYFAVLPQMGAPMTTVARDCDLRDTLEDAREGLWRDGSGFYVFDIFEMDMDVGIATATYSALQRRARTEQQEINSAVLYHWIVGYFPQVSGSGVIATQAPAPLPTANVRSVMEQLAVRPDIEHRRIVVVSEDLTLLELIDGKISETTATGGT